MSDDLKHLARRRDITVQELLRAMSFMIRLSAPSSNSTGGPHFFYGFTGAFRIFRSRDWDSSSTCSSAGVGFAFSSECIRIHPDVFCLSRFGSLVELCLSLVASSILGPCKARDQRRIFVLAGKTRQRANDSRDYLSVCFTCLNSCTHGFEERLKHLAVER